LGPPHPTATIRAAAIAATERKRRVMGASVAGTEKAGVRARTRQRLAVEWAPQPTSPSHLPVDRQEGP
jgi:hypothetical protein